MATPKPAEEKAAEGVDLTGMDRPDVPAPAKDKAAKDIIDFAGLNNHMPKVPAVTKALKQRATFVLPAEVSVLSGKLTGTEEEKKKQNNNKRKDPAKDFKTDSQDEADDLFIPETVPSKGRARKNDEEGRTKEGHQSKKSRRGIGGDKNANSSLAFARTKGFPVPNSLMETSSAGGDPMDVDGRATTAATTATSIATGAPPVDGHIRQGWVYNAELGAYFPPTGPVGGTPMWSCSKCGGKHKTQDKFFVDSTGARLAGRKQCAPCLLTDFRNNRWKPNRPW